MLSYVLVVLVCVGTVPLLFEAYLARPEAPSLPQLRAQQQNVIQEASDYADNIGYRNTSFEYLDDDGEDVQTADDALPEEERVGDSAITQLPPLVDEVSGQPEISVLPAVPQQNGDKVDESDTLHSDFVETKWNTFSAVEEDDDYNTRKVRSKDIFVSLFSSVKYSRDLWPHWLTHYANDSLGLHAVPRSNYNVILHFNNLTTVRTIVFPS